MRSRSARLFRHTFKLAIFAAAGAVAVRYFAGTLLVEGWTPRTFFALLLLTGAVSLAWRSALDVGAGGAPAESVTDGVETAGPRIRRAKPADAAALSAVAARWFEETFGPHNDPEDMRLYMEKAFAPGQQGAELADPGRVTLLVEDEGKLAGYTYLRRTPPGAAPAGLPAGEGVEIQRFYVDPGHHGRGLARRLMEAALETAREMGGELLWLGVWEHNTRAIRFYEKQGFVDVGEQDFLLGTDLQHDRVMTRPL